jgi:ligand-binding sensor domain-containing protein
MAQDWDDMIWIGTDAGLFLLPSSVDFATSDRCERIIIPRNDGTNLADYLLDSEKITSIVVDGANRKWIGTEKSGVFLLSPDGIETIAHFTAENSPLLSNAILSIAIQESTGEVFIGTGDGLMSYMSDAVPVEDDFTNIYAYPNPVHPTYKGYVVIKGLMADTEVRIVDASGNLVTVLQGLGGEVIWDITNTSGNRVSSGVYTIICNTKGGNAYGTTKVLIMN